MVLCEKTPLYQPPSSKPKKPGFNLVLCTVLCLIGFATYMGIIPAGIVLTRHFPELIRVMIGQVFLTTPTTDGPMCSLTAGAKVDFQGPSLRHRVCLDFSRPGCRSGNFRVALYPPLTKDAEAELQGTKDGAYMVAIYKAFMRSPYFVADPQQACVLVPSFVHNNGVTTGVRIHGLKAWQASYGRNFLLINFDDHPTVEFDTGYAMVAKAGWSERYYRPSFDLSIMAPGKFSRMDLLYEGWKQWAYNPRRTPKYFVTFQGAMDTEVRGALLPLHDPAKGVVVSHKPMDSTDEDYNYSAILTDTQFAFCPRGNGLYSYRLHEAVSAGAVPVVFADDGVHPFPEILDWKSIGVVIPEALAADAVRILRALSPEEIFEKRCRLFVAVRRYMWGTDGIVNSTLNLLHSNIRGFTDASMLQHFSHHDLTEACRDLYSYAKDQEEATLPY